MSLHRFDPIAAIEACYAPARDERAWLEGLALAFEPLAYGLGCAGRTWEVLDGRARLLAQASRGPLPTSEAHMGEAFSRAPAHVVEGWFAPSPVVDTARQRLRRLRAPEFDGVMHTFEAAGIADALVLYTRDPGGRCVTISLPSAQRIRLAPRAQHRLVHVAAHLETAARLRARAAAHVEAVLEPDGEVQHAVGEARSPAARASLADAVRRAERARGRLRSAAPDEALDLWRGLVEGRWSLVEHLEADGRRLVLARRNRPGVPDPKALSPREREVLAHVALGHSNKSVAYALGLAGATVATHLKSALAKLGVRTRGQAIALLSGTTTGCSSPRSEREVG